MVVAGEGMIVMSVGVTTKKWKYLAQMKTANGDVVLVSSRFGSSHA